MKNLNVILSDFVDFDFNHLKNFLTDDLTLIIVKHIDNVCNYTKVYDELNSKLDRKDNIFIAVSVKINGVQVLSENTILELFCKGKDFKINIMEYDKICDKLYN